MRIIYYLVSLFIVGGVPACNGADLAINEANASGKVVSEDSMDALESLVVAEEDSCTIVRRHFYVSCASVRFLLFHRDGPWSKYTGGMLDPLMQGTTVQVEHIVSLQEAAESGLCNKDRIAKITFGSDPLNLVLAEASVNSSKGARDAAQWKPPSRDSWCWFAQRIIAVKAKYSLTVDEREKHALQSMLRRCEE